MLPFFRRIRRQFARDNKFFQYSRYAIGEIVLVVVGILIALQVNNWNERRIKAIAEEATKKKYLSSIYKDLIIEIKKIDINLHAFSEQYKDGMEVLGAFESKRPMQIDSSRIAYLIGWKLTRLIVSENEENTWAGLKLQGSRSLIGNDSLVSLLNSFYTANEALAERFNQIPKKSRMELRELISRCHNAKELEVYYKNGFNYSESVDKEHMNCLFSINNLSNLVSTIIISSIVNRESLLETQKMGNELIHYLEGNYSYLH